MATFNFARRQSIFLLLINALSPIINDLETSWRRYRNYRQSVHELSQLSDRDLAELGIYRCDIPRIAREAAADFGRKQV